MAAVEQKAKEDSRRTADWLGYVMPMAFFMAVTFVEGALPRWYLHLDILKVAAVSLAILAWRRPLGDIRPSSKVVPRAFLVGLAVCVLWIAWDRSIPYPHIGSRAAFNPFAGIGDPVLRCLFIGLTLYAMAVMVPVMEELFWRSFLIRYLTTPAWRRIHPWQYSRKAFLGVALLFGLAHTEWLVAVICAAAYGWLLRRTQSLFACVVAHSVTNLGLALYILQTASWRYW